MISEPTCVPGCGRIAGVIVLVAVLSATPGCGAFTTPRSVSPAVSVVAPGEVSLPATRGAMTLPVTVRLDNPTAQEIKLFAATPCAIFRWAVVTAKQGVQSKPNRLCAQVVVTDTLLPGRQVSQFYEIVLDADRYTAGGGYRLQYIFWGHTGHHDFTVEGIPDQY